MSKDDAIKAFKKKFNDKTKNRWEDRDNFEPKPKKYTLLEMEYDDDEDDDEESETKSDNSDDEEEDSDIEETKTKTKSKTKNKKLKSKLDEKLQDFLKIIFDEDMFKESLKTLNIDTKKMPLGKISKSQIDKGFSVLEELEDIVNVKFI